jgi:Domain of unknown function (DUF4129)
VSRRRLVPLALGITALLAIVAVAAHGRPLGSSGARGNGLPAAFWDYVFTTFLVLVLLLALVAFALLFLFRRDPDQRPPYYSRMFRALAILIVVAALLAFLGHNVNIYHLLHPNGPAKKIQTRTTITGPSGKNHRLAPPASRHVQFRWEELVAVLGLLLVLGVAAAKTRRRLEPEARSADAAEALAAALDDSLDDLRADPDLRRAIVAAYARMETALAAAGIPRRPAEAPLEYLERALLALDTSAGSVRRLTDLFEWARFSQYEPEPPMRDEAVDALIAVRAELRASELVPT